MTQVTVIVFGRMHDEDEGENEDDDKEENDVDPDEVNEKDDEDKDESKTTCYHGHLIAEAETRKTRRRSGPPAKKDVTFAQRDPRARELGPSMRSGRGDLFDAVDVCCHLCTSRTAIGEPRPDRSCNSAWPF